MRERLFHPWLVVRVRFLLGLVFLVAAWPKLLDPPGFAKAVAHYDLLPAVLVPAVALTLPWLEALAGLALVLGVWIRPAALWAGLMLLAFTGALGFNLARGHAVDCGCFEVAETVRTDAERLADMRSLLLRDAGLLLLVLHAWSAARKPE